MHLTIQEKSRAMAKNYSELQGVMEILREVFKLPRRNKKIFLFIILSTIISYFLVISLSKTLATISLLPLINAYSSTIGDPENPEHVKQSIEIVKHTMLLVSGIILLMTVVSLFSMVATIYVSAMSYLERDLKFKDLYSKIKKIWIRPVVTWCYVSLLSVGYSLAIFLPLLVLVVLARGSIIIVVVGIFLILVAVFVNIYFALVWMLSFVRSVLEDSYGLLAIGKAEELVKGRKVVGLILTLSFMILGAIVFLVSMILGIRVLIMFSLITLVKMMSMMTYTVLYLERKQSHGELVEVEEDMGYSRVSSAIALVDSALP